MKSGADVRAAEWGKFSKEWCGKKNCTAEKLKAFLCWVWVCVGFTAETLDETVSCRLFNSNNHYFLSPLFAELQLRKSFWT